MLDRSNTTKGYPPLWTIRHREVHAGQGLDKLLERTQY